MKGFEHLERVFICLEKVRIGWMVFKTAVWCKCESESSTWCVDGGHRSCLSLASAEHVSFFVLFWGQQEKSWALVDLADMLLTSSNCEKWKAISQSTPWNTFPHLPFFFSKSVFDNANETVKPISKKRGGAENAVIIVCDCVSKETSAVFDSNTKHIASVIENQW